MRGSIGNRNATEPPGRVHLPRPPPLHGVAAHLVGRRHQDRAGADDTRSANTTLNVYAHLWPDADESTRSAIGAVIAKRVDSAKSTAY
ncbi:hypothetical protein RHCRD62_30471 [Rhodococcus sp. RD6.2]|nr:hypothetical protein RHCRD62_30471 [Rhodococcus sp. RD6.2]